MAGRRVPGLADLRVQPEVGDQLAPVREPADVTDRRQKRDRDDQVDARNGHQPTRLGPVERVVRDRPIDQRDLAVEEVDLAQAAVERLALLDRQLKLGQPRAALLAEQITRLGAALQAAHQDRVDLVLGARARRDQLRAARQPAARHPRALVRHPDTV